MPTRRPSTWSEGVPDPPPVSPSPSSSSATSGPSGSSSTPKSSGTCRCSKGPIVRKARIEHAASPACPSPQGQQDNARRAITRGSPIPERRMILTRRHPDRTVEPDDLAVEHLVLDDVFDEIGDHDARSRRGEHVGCSFPQTGATAGHEKRVLLYVHLLPPRLRIDSSQGRIPGPVWQETPEPQKQARRRCDGVAAPGSLDRDRMFYSFGDRLGPAAQPREGTPLVVLRRRFGDALIEACVRVLPV